MEFPATPNPLYSCATPNAVNVIPNFEMLYLRGTQTHER